MSLYCYKMKNAFDARDTICAICTPVGLGSIAVIRVSGPDSFKIVKKLFKPKNKEKFSKLEPGKIYIGDISNENKILDESLCIFFASPKSLTGEDVVEVHTHGGNIVPNSVIKALVFSGARIANPGEFSFRAYQNGKIDLLKAESIAALISSQTEMSAELSIKNISGEISKKFNDIRDLAVTLLAEIEARVDFPEDEVPSIDKSRIDSIFRSLLADSKRILNTYIKGRLAINGLRVSIIGQPNAGKSTFLNTILNEDRAIVSPDPGTTRDVLEAAIVHKGLNIIFSDTAGIRKAGGLIEAEGVRRAKEKVKFSDLTLILVDQAVLRKNPNIANELFDFVPRGKMLLVASKIDLYYESIEIKKLENKPSSLTSNQAEPPIGFHLSSKTNQGIDELLDRIYELSLGEDPVDFKEGVLTTERQVELLKKATTHLEAGLNLFKKDEYMEIVSIEIRAFISTIADITGEVSNEEIYEKLFSNFCIGK